MSGFSHMELSSSSAIASDSNHYNMKQFIIAVREYLAARNEDTANIINRHLQLLSVTIDLSVFDPHTSIVAEFFVSLHELLSGLEPRSGLSWCCVNVLRVACRNSAARNALIHTYQFLPPLSRLLSDQITTEKKTRLLSLMQELTCGIKISWQIPHLPHLMSTLTRWVGTEQEDIIALSLGVLVNLCYKNLPAIYTLSRCLDIKKFMKTIMPLQGIKFEVHVCKLCIILENMYGKVPEESFVKLIEVTFKSIVEAFKARDSILLRHVVEFFLDIKLTNAQQNVIVQFDEYDSEINKLLSAVETDSDYNGDTSEQDAECMSLVLEFIHSLVELKLPTLLQFHERIIKLSLKWIQIEVVCSQALLMLRTIAMSSNRNKNSLLEPLLSGLPIFLVTLEHTEEEIPTHLEYNKRMSALMELLRALTQVDSLRDRVLSVLKEQHLYKIFVPLVGSKSPRIRANDADTYSNEAINLYVNAMGLVDELAKHSELWKNIHLSLLQQKQMHMILAQALVSGPKSIKALILSMVASQQFPKEDVASAMGELQQFQSIEVKSDISRQMADNLCFPNMSVAQSEKLDEIMNKIKSAVTQPNNLFNISTSDVMELYEYKLASMGHAERAAVASLEAASQRCTHLQHRTAQLSAELNRLHQLLFHTQQCSEEAMRNRDAVTEKYKELVNRLDAEKGRTVLLTSQLAAREHHLDETSRKLRETELARMSLEEQYTNLKEFLTKLQETLQNKERACDEKEELLNRANSAIKHLKSQNALLELELSSKSKELTEVMEDLIGKKQIIESITKLANSQMQPSK